VLLLTMIAVIVVGVASAVFFDENDINTKDIDE
jgi:hypothetical protein